MRPKNTPRCWWFHLPRAARRDSVSRWLIEWTDIRSAEEDIFIKRMITEVVADVETYGYGPGFVILDDVQHLIALETQLAK